MNEAQLAIIEEFFKNTDCNDTAKQFANHLVKEVKRLQDVEKAYEALKKAL